MNIKNKDYETLVSVIMPVYNASQYLDRSISSIRRQSIADFELICVDDGSSDDSYEKLLHYSLMDNRIKVVHQNKSNAGVARNVGLDMARGEYLFFFDADDWVESTLLEKCVKNLQENESDICVFEVKVVDAKNKAILEGEQGIVHSHCTGKNSFSPYEMSMSIFNTFQNWPWNKMFRHEFIKKNQIRYQEIDRTNDLVFVNLALALASKISIIPEVLVHYHVGNAFSLQGDYSRSPCCFLDAYKVLRVELIKRGLYEVYKVSFLNDLMEAIFFHLHNMKECRAYNYLLSSVVNGVDIEFEPYQIDIRLYNSKYWLFYRNLFDTDGQLVFDESTYKTIYENVIDSYSYKIGRSITYIPRKIRGLIKGLKYDFRMFKEK